MKIIETVIVYEDYNYVEGNLELKFSGTRLSEKNEKFSIENILSTKLYVTKKHIAPNIPFGINRDRVFALQLPYTIPTYVTDNDKQLAFNANYDKIICDDNFVTENGELKIDRFNTIKDQGKIFSTLNVTVYGLKKNKREEVEKVTFYELFPNVIGDGTIEINPKKEYYAIGEKIKIKAKPNKNASFIKWKEDFSEFDTEEVHFVVEKDTRFEAVFTEFQAQHTTKLGSIIESVKQAYGSNARLGNNTPETENVGCLESLFEGIGVIFQIIGYLIYAAILIGILVALISAFGWYSLWIIGFFVALWLLPKLFQVLGRFNILGYLFNLLFLGIIILSIYNLTTITSSNSSNNFTPPNPTEVPKTIEKVKENTSIDYIHLVEWKDFDENNYSTYLKVNSDYVTYENNVKQSFPYLRTEQDYNSLLNTLHTESEESLYFIYQSLDSIKAKNTISYEKFPDVIVSMIQSIPYYAILDDSCNPYDYQDQSIRELLQNNPCQGYIKYGIKSPAEFLKDLKADCDSRTLLLYSLLKHYNYDVAIFGSDYYKHSLLGIHITKNIAGLTYKVSNGKRYYLWETTNTGFEMGRISKPIRNTNYWTLNLK
ncbi:hypothetical protein SAMN04487989_10228 [Bizionia echini]|uniref:Uncharacterized protein n=1 Tax=Bizionia echini TaxID=649333 RepID=A0A1I5AGT0_9FLAO|nr:DUF2304 domain-containing protein [Bizionia echini]SFN61419.1 hypothetical protein SAMN04487989_10228 [Bizionia echini]